MQLIWKIKNQQLKKIFLRKSRRRISNFEETAEYDELQSVILEKLRLAFWDKMQDEIKKNYEGLLAILNEVKDRICNLIPNRKDLHKNILIQLMLN